MTAEAPRELRGGRYVLLAPLGQGSQGTTWDAVDKREGREVAVKAFDVRGARAWKDVELAEREARVLSELSHPSLPRYIEHFEDDGTLYLVMEKVHGKPLSAGQRSGPRMKEEELLRFLQSADDALTYLHGRSPPVVHRDLKPSNVIRRADGSYAFVDFGAVRDRLRPEGGSTVVGTFGYMAPEQFQGRAGPASDVYAIGATAIAMLTGQEPEKLPHRGLSLDVDAALGSGVSPWVKDVLKEMLEPDPDKRASRIAPLLERAKGSGRRRSNEPRPPGDHPWDAWANTVNASAFGGDPREVARAAKRALKKARREARRSVKQARRPRRHRHELPLVVRILFAMGLAIAGVAVTFSLQVAVPLLLVFLSLLFGKALRRAAEAVKEAGREANGAIDRAQARVASADYAEPPAMPVTASPGRVRVEPSRSAGVRVVARPENAPRPTPAEELEEDDPDEEQAPERRARR